ncbi:MAG: hypothetical protein JWM53_6169 [bacterium]|nr:hypothetical protein [bacterium]
MRASVVVVLLAIVVAGVECKRTNGAYCDVARPCPNGFACDETARECHLTSIGGGDMAVGEGGVGGCAQCGGTTPICVAMTCVSCLSTSDGDGACTAISPSTPYCATSGACVGCRDANDCGGATPFCDATSHVCRGCVADSECPSLVCDLTPASPTHGKCIPIAQVEYVDGSAATNGNGLTPTTPKLAIQDAINHAVGADNRPYVHIAAGSYNENVGVNNKTIYLVGANGAIIHPTNSDALGASGGGSLTVRNLVAMATNGNAGLCSSATLTAYRSQFINSSQVGVYTSSCQLLLDGVWVHGNSTVGISLSGGNFTIINSIITKNGGAGGVTQVTAGTTMVFANNTVADNTSSTTAYAGVNCAAVGSFETVNSIFYNNKLAGGAIAETNCPSSFNASDDVSIGPQSTVDLTGGKTPGFKGGTPLTADSYHLVPTSPCRNEATMASAPDHDFDFEHRPDATSMIPDIGADEVP